MEILHLVVSETIKGIDMPCCPTVTKFGARYVERNSVLFSFNLKVLQGFFSNRSIRWMAHSAAALSGCSHTIYYSCTQFSFRLARMLGNNMRQTPFARYCIEKICIQFLFISGVRVFNIFMPEMELMKKCMPEKKIFHN